MACTVTGSQAAKATSVAIPTHAIGDIIVIWAFRDGNTAVPGKPNATGTVPAWVDIDTGTGANTCAGRTAYFVATATTHTSGTWSNATGMIATVLTGQAAAPIGGHAKAGGTGSNTASAPAITLTEDDGTSVVLEFYGHRSVTAWSAAPAGYTNKTSHASEVCLNTKDVTTTADAIAQPATTSSSSGYYGAAVEILAAPPPLTVVGPVAYDSTGAGVSDDTSWVHTLGSEASALLVGYSCYDTSLADDWANITRPTVKCGTTSMTRLGAVIFGDGNSFIELWGLLLPPTGEQTITINGGSSSYWNANSVAYTGVSSFGTPVTDAVTAVQTSNAPTITVPSVLSDGMAFALIGSYYYTLGSPSGTSRYMVGASGSDSGTLIEDATGTGNVQLSATINILDSWAAIGVNLLAPVVSTGTGFFAMF